MPEDLGSLAAMVGDVWKEIEAILDEHGEDNEHLKMLILGAFQREAEAFGFSREGLCLPVDDAVHIFARNSAAKNR